MDTKYVERLTEGQIIGKYRENNEEVVVWCIPNTHPPFCINSLSLSLSLSLSIYDNVLFSVYSHTIHEPSFILTRLPDVSLLSTAQKRSVLNKPTT